MADTKDGRDKKAQDADRRQRERDVEAAVERGDEPEPPIDDDDLDALESELESLSFPATGLEVVAAIGDRQVESVAEGDTVAELVPETDVETFESPAAVRSRIRRPTIAGAMKRVIEAVDTLPNAELSESQRDAYERTFLELERIDIGDDDEGITVIGDWIVERIHDTEKLPGSRDVRRQAAKFCRSNGYEVRNDEWLGV
jgi:hypothetical protein